MSKGLWEVDGTDEESKELPSLNFYLNREYNTEIMTARLLKLQHKDTTNTAAYQEATYAIVDLYGSYPS